LSCHHEKLHTFFGKIINFANGEALCVFLMRKIYRSGSGEAKIVPGQ